MQTMMMIIMFRKYHSLTISYVWQEAYPQPSTTGCFRIWMWRLFVTVGLNLKFAEATFCYSLIVFNFKVSWHHLLVNVMFLRLLLLSLWCLLPYWILLHIKRITSCCSKRGCLFLLELLLPIGRAGESSLPLSLLLFQFSNLFYYRNICSPWHMALWSLAECKRRAPASVHSTQPGEYTWVQIYNYGKEQIYKLGKKANIKIWKKCKFTGMEKCIYIKEISFLLTTILWDIWKNENMQIWKSSNIQIWIFAIHSLYWRNVPRPSTVSMVR